MTLQHPRPEEYDAYYGLYVDQAPAGDVLENLASELVKTQTLLASLSAEEEIFRYAPDKWSVREIVGHLVDTEWTFAYRCLCFARSDPAELPGFDQDLWARNSNAGERPLAELTAAFACARNSSLAVFAAFDPVTWQRSGVANGLSFSVRCVPYIMLGHEIHHRKVIAEHYLSAQRGER